MDTTVAGRTQKRIILWSVPRALSTAMCRVMMNSGYSTQILFQTFSEPHYFGPEHDASNPYGVTESNPSFTYENAMEIMHAPYEGKELVFAKLISYHMAPDHLTSEWIPDGYVHTFMIRHPRRVCMSAINVSGHYILEKRSGFPDILQIIRLIQESGDRVIVLDADDLLVNPEGMLRAYCSEVGLQYRDSMVNWEPVSETDIESIFRLSRLGRIYFNQAVTTSRFQRRPKENLSCDQDDDVTDPQIRETIENFVQDNIQYYEQLRPLCFKV